MPSDAIEAIGTAATILAEHPDAIVQAIAEHLLSYPSDLIERLTGAENTTGRSARDTVILERRDILLRRLGETASPIRLAGELRRYFTDAWLPRDRTRPVNPYGGDDRRATLWQIFRLRPQPISLRHLRVILGRQV